MCFHMSDGYQPPGRKTLVFKKGEHVLCDVRSLHILEPLQNVGLHVTLVTRALFGDSLRAMKNFEINQAVLKS